MPRDRTAPHFVEILRQLGNELCSNLFLLMLYWHSKLFKGFDSYKSCSIFSLQYCLIFSAFLPLPSHLPPPNIPTPAQWGNPKATCILSLPKRPSCKVLRSKWLRGNNLQEGRVVVLMQQFPPLRALYKHSVHKPLAVSACQKSEASAAPGSQSNTSVS